MKVFFDPRDRATIDDPIPVLQSLQRHDPIHWCEPLRSWVVTRYDDAKTVLRNDDFSADRITPFYQALSPERQAPIQEIIRHLSTWVAFKDPPDHGRLRNAMKAVFNPEAVAGQRSYIERSVASLADRLVGREHFDFIADYAFPLPALVILHLLGLPERDMDDLKEWSNQMQAFIGSATTSPEKYSQAEQGAISMAQYFRAAIAQRRQSPTEDLLTQLVNLCDNEGALSEDEIVGTAMLFLFGGHETTTNLIGNGVRALLSHPDQLQRLRDNPELIDTALEEILRFDGPTGASVRIIKNSHTLQGVEVEAGQRVFVMINAANHDPSAFDRPELFDIGRTPNLHLTFNYGPHFCLGAPLARLEGKIAITEIIRRLPDLTLSADHYPYMDTMIMRGVREMPVSNVPQ